MSVATVCGKKTKEDGTCPKVLLSSVTFDLLTVVCLFRQPWKHPAPFCLSLTESDVGVTQSDTNFHLLPTFLFWL